ncbi:MAG TPA: DMT family protein [Caulobacteraceae bacterium]
MNLSWARLAPFGLLLASNVFMTFAWYGRLKFKNVALPLAVLVSWLIAGLEYSLAVPANRIGSAAYTTAELKTIQEAITLIVFALFSVFYLDEPLKITTLIGFGFIFVGAIFVFINR